MKIPAEATSPNDSGRFADAPGTRPVDVAPRLASDLPEGFPKPRQAPEDGAARRQRAENKPERRQHDRRKKNTPTTLDTRLAQSRRESESPISVTI